MSSGDIPAGMSMMRRSIVWGLGSRVWHTRRHVDYEVVQVTPLRSADELLDEGRDFCTAQDERVDRVDEPNLVSGFGFQNFGFGICSLGYRVTGLGTSVCAPGFRERTRERAPRCVLQGPRRREQQVSFRIE